MERKIPINNIYHMLCYAWDVLKEKDIVKVEIPDNYSMLEFFAKILNSGTNYLIRKGLDRGYIEENDELACIKGKIDFSNSLRKLSFYNAKAYCTYDNFTYDVLHNRVLKSTFNNILKIKDLDKELRKEITKTSRYFIDVGDTEINRKIVQSIKLNRNNHIYRLLLEICLLIEENLAINEKNGEVYFKDFVEDPRQMSTLYEKFIFNYYKKKLPIKKPKSKISVKRDEIQWSLDNPVDEETKRYLPKMKTDVSIYINDRKIILDAKYYQDPLKVNYEKEELYSSNLYQLFAYIQNSKDNKNIEGILLYPTITKDLDLEYVIKGNTIKINTINLGLEDWRLIEESLDKILG